MKSEIGTGNTILLRIEMPLRTFLDKFKSPSHFFRRWRYSQNSINGVTNFQFGNFFITGGFYSNQIKDNQLLIHYLILTKVTSPIIKSSLKIRIQKLIPEGQVQFDTNTENFNTLLQLIKEPSGKFFIKSFGVNNLNLLNANPSNKNTIL